MRYNLSDSKGIQDAKEHLNGLIRLGKWIEIKQVATNRTLSQNSFFHLLLGYYGSQVGYFPNEAKTIVKRAMPDIFVYEKNGEKFLRSSADLSGKEMQKVLDRFYVLAGEQGVELPLADNEESRNLMINEIERAKV